MQDDLDISKRVDSLRELMEKHLGIKARSFEKACNRAGRQLPRRLRGPAARLIEAASMAENPKLQRYMDATAVAADYRAIEDWLEFAAALGAEFIFQPSPKAPADRRNIEAIVRRRCFMLGGSGGCMVPCARRTQSPHKIFSVSCLNRCRWPFPLDAWGNHRMV